MMKANKFVVILASIAFGAVFAFGPTRSYEVVEKDPFGPSDWGLDPVDGPTCAVKNPWVFPSVSNQACNNALADIAEFKALGDAARVEALKDRLSNPPGLYYKPLIDKIDVSRLPPAVTKFDGQRCVDLNPWMSKQVHELHCREYAILMSRAQKESDELKQKYIVLRATHRGWP